MANSTEKAMMVLRAVSDGHGQPVSLQKLSYDTGINKSTLSHIIKTLNELGYIQRISHNEGYICGPELFFLTRYGRYESEISNICHPVLKWLNKKTGYTVILTVLRNGKKYIIDHIEGAYRYVDSQADIINDDAYRTATGKVILANMSMYDASVFYRANKQNGSEEFAKLKKESEFLDELNKIRDLPVYLSETFYENVKFFVFASPLFESKKLAGAMGLIINSDKEDFTLTEDEKHKMSHLMLTAKKEAERRLNFNKK